jgi:SWI/SNF-related matrix-associated actin-dependent regulator of chromatin subfamily A3
VIQIHLQKAGFEFVRLDGSRTPAQRDFALSTFANSEKHTVMLASLTVCSLGVLFSFWTLLTIVEFGGSKSSYHE